MSGAEAAAVALAALAGVLATGPPSAAARARRLTASAPARPPGRTSELPRLPFRRPRATARALQAELTELLGSLAAELRTGADPRTALAAAARGLPRLTSLVAVTARPGDEVAGALQRLAALPGGALAGQLRAAWLITERTGAGLADPVARLHAAAQAEQRLRGELAAQLAGPRATARLLAALPAVGVALGSGLGADPLGFLLGTPAGRLCGVLGLTLLAVGAWWSRRIVRSVADQFGLGP